MLAPLLVYGLINSVSLALIALGFSLTYGISRIANFAHGGLYVLTGFSAWFFLNRLHLNYYISVILALVLISFIVGFIFALFLLRVRGKPLLEARGTFATGHAAFETLRSSGVP